MKKTREELQKNLDEAIAKVEQFRRQQQRLENRITDYQQSKRKRRNHRLITRGADVESVIPEVRDMSQAEFRLLIEQIFFLPEVAALVKRMTDQQEGK